MTASPLDQFETLLELVIEKKLFGWLPTQTTIHAVINDLINAIQASDTSHADMDYLVHVSPADFHLWFTNQSDLIDLGRIIQHQTQNLSHITSTSLAFHILADAQLPPGEIFVQNAKPASNTGETEYLTSRPYQPAMGADPNAAAPNRSYLSTQENQIFPLDKTVTNIGRREDNDIVFADQRVSRLHAQIRKSGSRFLLFDLNSTGGTLVNDKPITQHGLVSGDVISFGGLIVIFAEDGIPSSEGDTSDLGKTAGKPGKASDEEENL